MNQYSDIIKYDRNSATRVRYVPKHKMIKCDIAAITSLKSRKMHLREILMDINTLIILNMITCIRAYDCKI